MEKLKMKVLMLPTEKATMNGICKLANDRGIVISNNPIAVDKFNKERMFYEPQHLYFISDREIEKGDWVTDSESYIKKCNQGHYPYQFLKKIEASSDPSLHFPLINQQFIEAYVESQGKITEVMIEMEYWSEGYVGMPQQIVLHPKVRRDNTVIVSKIKDTWTREEVNQLVFRAYNQRTMDGEVRSTESLNKWIEQNL